MGDKAIQLREGRWYDVHEVEEIECCLCGLTHEIKTRVKGDKIQQTFRVDHKLTAKAVRRKLRS